MLAGKTAIITGGNSGIGLATAQEYVKEGASVIITGRNKEKLDQAVAALGGGTKAKAVVLDVCKLDQFKALEEEVKTFFGGKLDILFANAGVAKFAPVEMVDQAFFDLQFNTNVRGLLFTVKSMAPFMQKGGSILFNCSAVNTKGNPQGAVYFATKAAVRSLGRSLAAEYGQKGIRVNCLSPGLVPDTALNDELPPDAMDGFVTQISSLAALKRVGKPFEIARTAVFLAGDDSSYVAAADLVVDGGWRDL